MQAHPLTPPHPHSNLQSLKPIEAVHALAIDLPALTAKHDVNAQIPESRSAHRDLTDAHAQTRLVLRRALAIPGRPTEASQPARAHTADLKALVHPMSDLLAA